MIKELLEKWCKLEPHLCHKQLLGARIECFTIQLNGQWETILVYNVDTDEAQMKIQWIIQQAIVEKGWRFKIVGYQSTAFYAEVRYGDYGYSLESNNLVETLLAAYLEVLEQ